MPVHLMKQKKFTSGFVFFLSLISILNRQTHFFPRACHLTERVPRSIGKCYNFAHANYTSDCSIMNELLMITSLVPLPFDQWVVKTSMPVTND